MRTPQQHTLAVQFEGPVLDELDAANAEALGYFHLPLRGGERRAAGVQVRRVRRPEIRGRYAPLRNLGEAVPRGQRLRPAVDGAARGVGYFNRHRARRTLPRGIV